MEILGPDGAPTEYGVRSAMGDACWKFEADGALSVRLPARSPFISLFSAVGACIYRRDSEYLRRVVS